MNIMFDFDDCKVASSVTVLILKPGQNKKGQKFFQLHHFLNIFLQLAAEKKYSKIGAAGNFFGPSYFVTTLVIRRVNIPIVIITV